MHIMRCGFPVRCIQKEFPKMKHHSILSLLIFLLGFGSLTTSCEDMLTPDMDRYATGFSGKDTLYFYLGIVRNVQDMVEQNQLLGDIRSDLADTTLYTSDSVAAIATYDRSNMVNGENSLLNRAAYYKVVNQCNFYLAKVDTMAKKNNVRYMRKEYAQVEAIRAWAYLQLVQTYGKVPFITQPVDNANTGWEKNPEAWATADNLVDLLGPKLQVAASIEEDPLDGGYPSYKTFSTGAGSIASSKLLFYSNIILGDLYLLRGNSKDDYKQAAKYYYRYLSNQMEHSNGVGFQSYAARFYEMGLGANKSYMPSPGNWTSRVAANYPTGENITVIPSASNSSFGRVLTNVDQIYGFDPHSTNTTTTEETKKDDGTSTSTTTTTGSLILTPNVRSRQIGPSQAYLNLSKAQNYTAYKTSSNNEISEVEYYEGQGDARMYGTTPEIVTKTGDRARFITKDASTPGGSVVYASNVGFKFYRGLYRMRQVYLRYAEAINRAGYPRLAFAVLRNGLDYDKLPQLQDSIVNDTVGNQIYRQTIYVAHNLTNQPNIIDYIDVNELRRIEDDPMKSEYLDFSGNWWTNIGIHEFGSGNSCRLDSLYSYDKTVLGRVKDEELRAGNGSNSDVQSALRKLSRKHTTVKAEGEEGQEGEGGEDIEYEIVEVPTPDYEHEANEAEINAVETLIADECALEMAFEGTRMPDLIRFARHKNNSTFGANYGTQWLAWKIARRSYNLLPYENVTEKDGRLYNLLLNTENWYIPNPVY